MKLNEYPLASPLPTTAPHPADVERKLLVARQGLAATCAFGDGLLTNAITCDLGEICVQNTIYNDYFCCPANDFPYCGVGVTSCVDSAAMSTACTGDCLGNPAVLLCTGGFETICGVTRYEFSTLSTYLTGFSCGSAPTVVTAYDYYTSNGQLNTAAVVPSTGNGLSSGGSASPTAGTPITPVTPAPGGGGGSGSNSNISSTSSSGISGGAIAGIAIGALAGIAIIVGLLALLCIQRRRNQRRRQQQIPPNLNPAPMMQTPASPPPMNPHMSMASSMPSATSSTPLTQANIAAMSGPAEVLPSESASQVNTPGSVLSHGSPPTYHSGGGGSNSASQPQSGIGPLPGPQYPTGASAFPHANASSVMSPGSAFGSMPPVHAPSVSSPGPQT